MGELAARANSRQRPPYDQTRVKAENKNPPPPFITFYSFKGGVGRSMALINAACILAGHGRRVLAIDLDLEAPGISYLLLREKPASKPAKGFVDFIFDLLSRGDKAPLGSAKNPKAFLNYTAELPLPDTLQRVPGGSLRIMPAGRIDADYEKRRQAIDLHRLYLEQKGEPIVRHLRNLITESGEFDYVLIDSRTGFADEAGISVRDLADHLVVLHGLNHQNIEGTARFLDRLKRRVLGTKAMKIAFVASPIPLGEDDLCDKRIQVAERCFAQALRRPTKLRLQIPYHPRLALDETPFIFRRTQGALHLAYGRIENEVRAFNADTTQEWNKKIRQHLKEGRAEDAIQCIRKLATLEEEGAKWLARRAVEDSVGKETFLLYWEFYISRVGRDVNSLALAVEHFKRIEQKDQVEKLYREMLPLVSRDAERLHEIARYLWKDRGNISEAERLFERASRVSPRNPRILCNYGLFEEHQLKNFTKAMRLYRLATKTKPGYAWAFVLLATLLEKHQRRHAAAEQQYRRALALAPQESEVKRALAWFLAHRGKRLKEAEQLFRQCVVAEPNDARTIGTLAIFVWHYQKNYPDARKLHLRAVALDPRNANTAGNYAGFLLAQAELNEAENQILKAWGLAFGEKTQLAAEVAFYRCVCLKLQKKVDSIPLGYLKQLFAAGYERDSWRFDEVLHRLDGKLPAREVQFYTVLSEAILDSGKVEHLNTFDQWRKVKAIPLGKEI